MAETTTPRPRRASSRADAPAYDAFVSYSHAADGRLAPALQSGLQSLAKPWYRRRALRVFRDQTSLSASPELWGSIEVALSQARYFVLLASPTAADSHWVDQEVRWWRANRSHDTVLIALTDGELDWDDDQGDFGAESPIPPGLRDWFPHEPLWVDLRWARDDTDVSMRNPRFRDAVGELAAPIHGLPKDELIGEDISQHRRTLRLARGAVALLAGLLALAVVGGIVALIQRNKANDQARTSLSRQLAALADNLESSDLDTALLLAVQAYETEASSETRGALMRADTASPSLARLVQLDHRVSALVTSPDGDFAAVGLIDGSVVRVSLTDPDPAPEAALSLDKAVSSLSISNGGGAITASDGRRAMLWRPGSFGTVDLAVPAGQHADLVALSPSGATAAAHGVAGGSSASTISLYSTRTGASEAVHPVPVGQYVGSLQFSTDTELGLEVDFGDWEERRVADWQLLWSRSIGFGAHELGGIPSADGGWISATNGSDTVPIWATDGGGDRDPPDRTAEVSLSGIPTALAIGPTGRELAIADSGVIYVAPIAPPASGRAAAIALRGAGATGSNLIRFAGDGQHLVSASGDGIAIWDLGQLDRLASVWRVPLGSECNACAGPRTAISPDGDRLAIADGYASGAAGLIQRLDDGTAEAEKLPSNSYVNPVWLDGGSIVAFPITARPTLPGPSRAVPEQARVWRAGTFVDKATLAAPGADGQSVVIVDDRGRIFIRDGETGALLGEFPTPPGLSHGSDQLVDSAVDGSGRLVARLYDGSLTITDLDSGEIVGRPAPEDAAHIRYAGSRLLIQRQSGTLEVWDARGSARERTLSGDETLIVAPAGSPDGALVARPHTNGEITIADLGDGATLGTLHIPPEAVSIKTGIAFGPDGLSLTTVTEQPLGGAYVARRDLSPSGLIEAACRTAGRTLTAEEWDRLVGGDRPDTLACEGRS